MPGKFNYNFASFKLLLENIVTNLLHLNRFNRSFNSFRYYYYRSTCSHCLVSTSYIVFSRESSRIRTIYWHFLLSSLCLQPIHFRCRRLSRISNIIISSWRTTLVEIQASRNRSTFQSIFTSSYFLHARFCFLIGSTSFTSSWINWWYSSNPLLRVSLLPMFR